MTNESQSEPETTRTVWIYRSSKRLETYVYLPEADEFSQLPEPLRLAMGKLEFVMELDLYPGRKLARATAEAVLEAIEDKGFYLQMPPLDSSADARVH